MITSSQTSTLDYDIALEALAKHLDLPFWALKSYADEDTYGGWDNGAGRWPIGSLFGVEGQILYALVRATKPEKVVELGRFCGCSTTHLAAAVKANGRGHVFSVDIVTRKHMIPVDLQKHVLMIEGEASQWLETESDLNFIFEDTDHTTETTQRIIEAALPVMAPGGIMVHHDTEHYMVGPSIKEALINTHRQYLSFLVNDSVCGLGVWTNE